MEHFGAVFKLHLTEETRTQLPCTGYACGNQLVAKVSEMSQDWSGTEIS